MFSESSQDYSLLNTIVLDTWKMPGTCFYFVILLICPSQNNIKYQRNHISVLIDFSFHQAQHV